MANRMGMEKDRTSDRRGGPHRGRRRRVGSALLGGLILAVPGLAGANEDENIYALILDDDGVVVNVAVYHPVDSVGWLEAMEAQGANVIIQEENTVCIGSVLQPDGSFERQPSPPPPTAPEPPPVLPEPEPDQPPAAPEPPQEPAEPVASAWTQHDASPPPAPGPTGEIRTALIVEDGVVVNAAVYHTVDSVGWLELMEAQGARVIIVPEHSAGIGWLVSEDGSIVPPPPRPGLVWNGTEWRAPGTEDVQRPTDVQGWVTSRTEDVSRPRSTDGTTDAEGTDAGATEADMLGFDVGSADVSGWLIVPDEALDGEPTLEDMAARSIVMLESRGEVTPLLARFDGLAELRERADRAVDDAVAANARATGEPVDEDEVERLGGAVRRIADAFLRLFGLDGTD